jgi:hypothetical protein
MAESALKFRITYLQYSGELKSELKELRISLLLKMDAVMCSRSQLLAQICSKPLALVDGLSH